MLLVSVLVLGDVLAVELVLLGYVLVSVARDVVSVELLGYVLETSDDGVVLLVLGDVELVSYGELDVLEVELVELVVSLVLLDDGL